MELLATSRNHEASRSRDNLSVNAHLTDYSGTTQIAECGLSGKWLSTVRCIQILSGDNRSCRIDRAQSLMGARTCRKTPVIKYHLRSGDGMLAIPKVNSGLSHKGIARSAFFLDLAGSELCAGSSHTRHGLTPMIPWN